MDISYLSHMLNDLLKTIKLPRHKTGGIQLHTGRGRWAVVNLEKGNQKLLRTAGLSISNQSGFCCCDLDLMTFEFESETDTLKQKNKVSINQSIQKLEPD